VAARRLEHSQRSEHVHLCVELGLLHRRADVGLGGEVVDALGLDRVEQIGERLADVALVQGRARGQVLAPAGGEAVDDVHLVSACDERVDEMRADEAGSPGDGRSHRRILGTACS
jgi:hypothetical protein